MVDRTRQRHGCRLDATNSLLIARLMESTTSTAGTGCQAIGSPARGCQLIACLVSGRDRAAIAVISVRGHGASKVVLQNFTSAASREIHRGDVRYGTWHGPSKVPGDQDAMTLPGESVVVALLDELVDDWEIHCHGGEAAIERILQDLHFAGAAIVDSQDWLIGNDISMLKEESIDAISRVTTMRTAAIVLDQVRGAMEDFVQHALAFLKSDEVGAIESIHNQTKTMLGYSDLGKHLTEPWSVVLAGAPNVGKSSLINALVGYQRSITLDRPGTTRDVLHADAVIDGWPIVLSDTAGIRTDPSETIEQQGIKRACEMLRTADLVLWVQDAADEGGDLEPGIDLLRPSIRVRNKVDLISSAPESCRDSETLASQKDAATAQVVQTSATLGTGIDRLRQAIIATLIPEVPFAGAPVPLCDRQVRGLANILAANDARSMERSLKQLLGH